jgi:hypothetical protein
MSVLTALVDVGDGGGKGILVLEMLEEERELCPLHAEVAPIDVVANGGERIGDAVEFAGEFGVFIFEVAVPIYFCDCGWVVEAVGFFDEGVETSITTGEDGKEPMELLSQWGSQYS